MQTEKAEPTISTGLPVKGNKKRAESLLRQEAKGVQPETMQQVAGPVCAEYLTCWLRESVMNLSRILTVDTPTSRQGHHPVLERKRGRFRKRFTRAILNVFRYERFSRRKRPYSSFWITQELTDAFSMPLTVTGWKVELPSRRSTSP